MTNLDSKKINNFLGKDQFTNILKKSHQLIILNQKIKNLLGEEIKPYCQVANLVKDCLILLCNTGSIALHIRFSTPDLIRKFQADNDLKQIKTIQCKVIPFLNAAEAPVISKMALLSSETAKVIQDIADSVKDEKLKEALLRLARHTSTKRGRT